MMNGSRKQNTIQILWALVWAFAFVASAIVLKGSPAKDWVQSALFIGGITLWLVQSRLVSGSHY